MSNKMSTNRRAESALSTSSNELIDRQLNELMDADEASFGRENELRGGGKLVGDDGTDEGENITVMVRCRPLAIGANPRDSRPREAAVKVDETNRCVEANERRFFFDQVFGTDCDNERIYMRSARRLVDCAFRGYNCAIFLYGQTGTGKTYTHSSLTLAAFEHLFSLIQDSDKGIRFLIRASYYELYNEEIHDLLAPKSASKSGPKSLELRDSKERGVYVKDLTCFLVNNLAELKKLKQMGDKRRTTASTKMNEHSSRSHSIFSITIETVETELTKSNESKQPVRRSTTKTRGLSAGQPSIRVGHLNLIDLAGSERQSKSGATGSALKEASRINLSLTCLSLVIRALTDKSGNKAAAHVPYRNSKLTRLLSSSLGGNAKTILVACISADRANLDETLNTLRFASRTKLIKNKAIINEDPKDALLRKYRKQLEELRMKLNEHQHGLDAGAPSSGNRHRSSDPQLGQAAAKQLTDYDKPGQNNDEQLNKQLEMLKAKIMFGGENLLDKLELHERLLEASRAELEERRREEVKLRERLRNKKQTIDQVVQSKGSLESQLEYLDAKLKKAVELYRTSKLELSDLASEHGQLKEQLLQTIRSTSKEIKYVNCIIEDFIPREYLDLINAYAQYDDESDEWQIKYIALSGNNIAQTKRLVSSASAHRPGELAGRTVRRNRRAPTGVTS